MVRRDEGAATTSAELRAHNLARLLRAVHDGAGQLTRAELTRQLSLARGTATVLVRDLAGRHLIEELPGEFGAGELARTVVDGTQQPRQVVRAQLGARRGRALVPPHHLSVPRPRRGAGPGRPELVAGPAGARAFTCGRTS
jgi:hypothetical protein